MSVPLQPSRWLTWRRVSNKKSKSRRNWLKKCQWRLPIQKIVVPLHRKCESRRLGKFQSGQMGQTVNLLSFDFGGSNPSLPTNEERVIAPRFLCRWCGFLCMPGNGCPWQLSHGFVSSIPFSNILPQEFFPQNKSDSEISLSLFVMSGICQMLFSTSHTKARRPSRSVSLSMRCSSANRGSTCSSRTTVSMAEHIEGHA